VVIATGDNYGRVRLYRYPAESALTQSKASRLHTTHRVSLTHKHTHLPQLYRAHGGASPISKVRWASGDHYLISVSAKERIVLQARPSLSALASRVAELIGCARRQWCHDADDLGAADRLTAEVMPIDSETREMVITPQRPTPVRARERSRRGSTLLCGGRAGAGR
jgi:hypothetical protein